MRIHIHIYMYIHIDGHTCVYIYIYVVFSYLFMCLRYMYLHMYTYVYVYLHIQTLSCCRVHPQAAQLGLEAAGGKAEAKPSCQTFRSKWAATADDRDPA